MPVHEKSHGKPSRVASAPTKYFRVKPVNPPVDPATIQNIAVRLCTLSVNLKFEMHLKQKHNSPTIIKFGVGLLLMQTDKICGYFFILTVFAEIRQCNMEITNQKRTRKCHNL